MPVARRVSIGLLMVVVGLVAADFAIVRGLWDNRSPWAAVAVVTLPMIDVLILAAPQLRRGNPSRPYWLGFEVGGGLTVLVVGLLAASPTEVLFLPLVLIEPFLRRLGDASREAVAITLIVLFYTPAQLVPAVVAGKLSARYRLVIERR